MSTITFWEKPGCAGNARQKAVLTAAGLELDARDLLTYPWTREELESFVGGLPITEWFNRSAPRVKGGEIVPEELDREVALAALLAEPLLIRRPLMIIAGQRLVGFDVRAIEAALGHPLQGDRAKRLRDENLEACPGDKTGVRCGDERT